MKLRKLLRRTAAAAVAGAMALSISMPALAQTWNLSDKIDVDRIKVYVDDAGSRHIELHSASGWTDTSDETEETVITGSNNLLAKLEIADGASVTLENASFGEANASTEATVAASGNAQLTLKGNNTISGTSRGILVSQGNLKLTGDGSLTVKAGNEGIEQGYNGSVTADGSAMLEIRDDHTKENQPSSLVTIANGYTGQVKYYTNDAADPYLVIPEVQAVGYGITVNGTPVTSANKDDIIPAESGNYSLKYIPGENGAAGKLVGSGSLPALNIAVLAKAGTVDVELGSEAAPANVCGSLIVTGAHDVTATGTDIPTITSGATITCTGDVNLSNSGMGMAVSSGLTVTGAQNVTVTGDGTNPVVSGDVAITCTGNVNITSTGGMAVGGALKVENANSVTVNANANDTAPAISLGADISCKGDVNITSTNGQAVSTSLKVKGAHDVTVSGKGSPTVSGIADISCSGKVKLTNADCMVFSGDDFKINGATDVDVEVTGDNTSPAISTQNGAVIGCTGNVTITNSANIAVSGGLKVTNAKDVTISSKKNGPTVTKSLDISCSGKVKLTSADYLVFSGDDFKINGATDVVIMATEGSISPAVSTNSSAFIGCTGNVEITNEKGMAISGGLTVNGAKDVSITGDSGSPAIGGITSITNCTGNVEIANKYYMAIGGSLTVDGAKDVKITGNGSSPTIGGTASITCTGNVEITGDSDMAVGANLTVNGAKDVTVTGNGNGPAISGTATFNCSGKVTLTATNNIKAVGSMLTYTQSDNKAYTVKAGLSEDAAEQVDKIGAAGTTLKLEPVPTDYHYICITPEGWTDPSDVPAVPGTDNPDPDFGVDPADDGSGIAGAIVAGTLIGGAAIWSGYEITTRAILSELLPQGAAIPANRGALVLLLWAEKDEPEPESEPAFTDVTDPEMAKAAQWCVEQGYLDVKDGKFDPDGRMPKYKTIEIWKKAFPNQ